MSSVILARSENPAIHDVYRFRHQVFHDRLGWEVGSDQGLEHDRFDKLNPVHMFTRNRQRQVEACWRLLPTTGPYMLRDIFPQLLREETAPSDPHIWEISRFAVVPSAGRTPGRDQANICDLTFDLLRAGVDFADRNGIRHYVFVTSVAVERLLKSTGLAIYRFGDGRSQKVGKVLSVACWIDINDATRQAVYRQGTVSLPPGGCMKVLVVGHLPQTRQLLRVLRRVNRAFATHYRHGAEAIAATRRGGAHYDLVFLEDNEESPESQTVAEAIQAVDATIPIAFLRYPTDRNPEGQIPRLIGAFEHSTRGLRLLDCRLSGSPAKERPSPLPAPAEILFEYHLPLRVKDSLHG